MFVALYLAHGFNARTTTAVVGTLVSLSLTGVLALVFVEASRFTGFGSEEAVFLQVSAQQINLQGLLLGGIIIGTLGVLDDVTVTQASAVWQLRIANPAYSVAQLIPIGGPHREGSTYWDHGPLVLVDQPFGAGGAVLILTRPD